MLSPGDPHRVDMCQWCEVYRNPQPRPPRGPDRRGPERGARRCAHRPAAAMSAQLMEPLSEHLRDDQPDAALVTRRATHLGKTAVASSSILPGLSSRSATKIMLIAG